MKSKLISKTELASYLGVSERTIVRYKNQGMPFYQFSYKKVLYDVKEVIEWAKQRKGDL